MMTAGIVLLGVAGTSFGGAIATGVWYHERNKGRDDVDGTPLLYTIGLVFNGFVCAAVGSALLAIGAEPPPTAPTTALIPIVSAGPRGATLRWSF